MLDEIFNMVQGDKKYFGFLNVVNGLGSLVNQVEQVYAHDKDVKNTAIDLICQLLQQHKEPVDAQKNHEESGESA